MAPICPSCRHSYDSPQCKNVGVETKSIGISTNPDCIGPCEPGTSVNLEGIVWSETSTGVLVVNINWRGKTYIGTLLDTTKHDFAPPHFSSDSPTDFDGISRGMEVKRLRAKRRCVISATPNSDFFDKGGKSKVKSKIDDDDLDIDAEISAESSMPEKIIDEDSCASNSLSFMCKSKILTMSTSDLQSSSPSNTIQSSIDSKRTEGSTKGFTRISCKAVGCRKKFRNMTALRYHLTQSHCELVDVTKDEMEQQRNSLTPVPACDESTFSWENAPSNSPDAFKRENSPISHVSESSLVRKKSSTLSNTCSPNEDSTTVIDQNGNTEDNFFMKTKKYAVNTTYSNDGDGQNNHKKYLLTRNVNASNKVESSLSSNLNACMADNSNRPSDFDKDDHSNTTFKPVTSVGSNLNTFSIGNILKPSNTDPLYGNLITSGTSISHNVVAQQAAALVGLPSAATAGLAAASAFGISPTFNPATTPTVQQHVHVHHHLHQHSSPGSESSVNSVPSITKPSNASIMSKPTDQLTKESIAAIAAKTFEFNPSSPPSSPSTILNSSLSNSISGIDPALLPSQHWRPGPMMSTVRGASISGSLNRSVPLKPNLATKTFADGSMLSTNNHSPPLKRRSTAESIKTVSKETPNGANVKAPTTTSGVSRVFLQQ